MKHMEVKIIWTCGLLLIYLIGCFCAKVSDEHVTFLDKVMVWKGSCVMLPCEYKANKIIDKFIWYHNATYNDKKSEYDGTIVYDSKNKTAVDHSIAERVQYVGKQIGDCTIVIKNIQKQDEGNYQLRLLGTGFRWMSKQHVTITAPETGPTLEFHPLREIRESVTVTLTCSIRYFCPFNNITLYWIEDVNGTSTTNVRSDTSGILTTSSLVFHPSWKDDKKNITCVLDRDGGEADNKTEQLNVMYAPRYPRIVLQLDSRQYDKEDKITFVEGDNVTFECTVNSSNPDVTEIIWYKDEKKIKKPSESLKAEDAGKYMCEAGNLVGRIMSPVVNVDINYSPKDVQIEVPIKAVKENETVRLRCLSKTSKPKVSRYEWYKDGVLLKTSTSDVMELQLEWTHTGSYSCKALNDIGSGISERKLLNVQYAPQNVTLTVIPGDHVTEFTDVKLTCIGKGNPARLYYQFYLNNDVLSAGNHYHDLTDVKIQDIGEYYCSAGNSVGDRRSNVVSLHVSYGSATIGKFASIGVSSFIVLLILIFLIVRFRICIRNAFRRKAVDGKSDSSFFVLKKSNNESADNMGRQIPSMHSSIDQLNYSTVNVPAPAKRRINPPSPMEDNDITTVYSVVRKVPHTAEYENIASSTRDHEDSQDDIHYSVIANLNKKATDRERGPDVEYAKLRHS